MFNFNHLYYFYMVSKLGGVTKASKVLRVAQPALSAQIKTLESNLKRKLFQKSGRRLILSPEGERAFAFCKRIFESAEEYSEYLKHSDYTVRTRFKIGVSPQIERPFIADILSSLFRNKETKQVPLISMRSEVHSVLVEKLKQRELDAIVTGQMAYDPELSLLAELQMPVVAVAASSIIKQTQFFQQTSLAGILKKISLGLILPGETLKLRIETDLFLQKLKIRNTLAFESDLITAVIRAALDGVGVAFLPLPYVRPEINRDTLRVVGPLKSQWKHRIFLFGSIQNSEEEKEKILDVLKHYFEEIDLQMKKLT